MNNINVQLDTKQILFTDKYIYITELMVEKKVTFVNLFLVIQLVKSLFSSADNELFLHYIFMDNEFYLPTGPGFPLRVALSGTFTPGVKGGLRITPDMVSITFRKIIFRGVYLMLHQGCKY